MKRTVLTGSAASPTLPRIAFVESAGPYLDIVVETHPIRTPEQQEYLLRWVEEYLPDGYIDYACRNPQRADEWTFTYERPERGDE